jgi:uncharacterized RDD family membrane protein YckC
MGFGRKLLSKRLYAFNIDLIMIMMIEKSLMNLYAINTKQLAVFNPLHINNLLMKPLDTLLLTITIISYFTCSYYMFNGKSVGKALFGLRVFSKYHKEITFYDSFRRALGYFTCMIPMNLLFAIPFVNKSAKGLPDWLSETEIVTDSFYSQFVKEQKSAALELHYAYQQTIPLPDQSFSTEMIQSNSDEDFAQAA